jgi:LysR family glycine cleavage system transcriptional activator
MMNYRKNLPPLDTLTFFESAMRHMSFTAAARELFVSQAAVSKRIRQLEDWLGVPLFERRARRLSATAAGERLAGRIAVGLDFLDQAIAELRAPAGPVVSIASMTSVAMFWLQPRLRAFALADEACDFSLVSTDVPAELLRRDHHLVVIYCDGKLPGWHGRCLFGERLVPVAAPALAEAIGSFSALARAGEKPPLLDYPRHGPNWIDWTRWAALIGNTDLRGWPRRPCASYTQSVGLALRGEGIALGSLPLLESEIAAGRLCPLASEELVTDMGYYLLSRTDAAMSPDAERLQRLL